MVVRRLNSNNIPSELYHHGILGQKWGVRRYQNPDGSLTSAGYSRYGYGNGKTYRKTVTTYKKDKEIIKSKEKTDDKIVKEKTIKKGNKEVTYTKEKNTPHISKDTMKKVAIAVGIAAGVSLAVGVYRYRHNIVAKTLMDTTLTKANFQRIQTGNGNYIKNKFTAYTSYELGDKLIYGGQHAKLVQRAAIKNGTDPTVYTVGLKVGKTINVPSIQKTQNIVNNKIASDPKFKSALLDGINDSIQYLNTKSSLTPGQKKRFNTLVKARNSLISDGKDVKRITDAWNITLTNKNTNWKEYGKVLKDIKKAGYNAIWDTNDMYTGGYQSRSPVIILDRKILEKTSSKVLNSDSIRKRAKLSSAIITERNIIAAGNSIINAFSKAKVGYY